MSQTPNAMAKAAIHWCRLRADRQRNGAQHEHGCGFASNLDRQAPRILGAGIGQLLRRDQRKQIVGPRSGCSRARMGS